MSPVNEDEDSSPRIFRPTLSLPGPSTPKPPAPPAAANPKLSLDIARVHEAVLQRIRKPTSEAKKEQIPNTKVKVHSSPALVSPPPSSPPIGIKKTTSASIERDHTPHVPILDERVYLDCTNLRIIYAFLMQSSEIGNQLFRTSEEYCPSLPGTNATPSLDNLRWVKVSEKNKAELKKALSTILGELEKAHRLGKNEFIPDQNPRTAVVHAQQLREMLMENPKSKEKIHKSSTLRNLYRSGFIAYISPHAELRVLEDTANARKTIFKLFGDHQKDQIGLLKGILKDEQENETFPFWSKDTKKLHLKKIYTFGIKDEFIATVLYRENENKAVYARLNDENTRSLEPFFKSTFDLGTILLNTLKPITDTMSFHSYISSLGFLEKAKMEKFLKDGELRPIVKHLAKNQLTEWENQKILLMTALIEFAKRGCWLAKQLGKNPEMVQRHEESLTTLEVSPTGYKPLVIIIKNLAKILSSQSPAIIKQET